MVDFWCKFDFDVGLCIELVNGVIVDGWWFWREVDEKFVFVFE